jgi:hypothetical protein
VIWLGGTAYLLGPAQAPWWTVVVLLGAVGVAELLFRRWNDGHWPGSEGEPGAG